jgi:hypothetical protein
MSNQRQSARRESDRSTPSDRRQTAERRRGSDNRNVVFELCRSTLQLAIAVSGSGTDATKLITRSVRWRKEATSLFTDAGRRELADAFRTLVTEERLAGSQVRIALGGEFCVTRVISGSTDEVRREFAELEVRCHRYLTLGPGNKVLASSVEQLDARHEHVLLTVANERTIDVLLQITEALGIHVVAIEASLVALSRAQAKLRGGCSDACLVIQLDDRRAELGICHGGRLLLDYRPGGNTDATNVADVLALHLTRLQRNLSRHHSYLKSPIRQVYLAGEQLAVATAAKHFVPLKQFQVSILDACQLDVDWRFVAEPPGPELAAALGTALVVGQPESERRSPNLMERILAESREPMRPILIRSLLPLAAALLVAAGVFALFMRERLAVNDVRAKLVEMDPVRVRARELQQKLMAADVKLTQLTDLERQLPKPNWGQLLSHIAQSMPDDVWLDGLTFRDAQAVLLSGASYADSGVYDFVGHLEQVPELREIALEGTGVGHSPTGPTTSFNLKLSLTAPADPVN